MKASAHARRTRAPSAALELLPQEDLGVAVVGSEDLALGRLLCLPPLRTRQ